MSRIVITAIISETGLSELTRSTVVRRDLITRILDTTITIIKSITLENYKLKNNNRNLVKN